MNPKSVVCCLPVLLSGCWANQTAEQAADGLVGEIDKAAELSSAAFFYHTQNDGWPGSIEELRTFCSHTKENCPELDWARYTDVTFKKLPDGCLKVRSKGSGPRGEGSFSTVLCPPALEPYETPTCR